jgi:hypothetical protein
VGDGRQSVAMAMFAKQGCFPITRARAGVFVKENCRAVTVQSQPPRSHKEIYGNVVELMAEPKLGRRQFAVVSASSTLTDQHLGTVEARTRRNIASDVTKVLDPCAQLCLSQI